MIHRNRIDGEPLRWARTARDAFPWESAENAAGIEGPPEPYIRGWKAIALSLLMFLTARNADLSVGNEEKP